MKGIGILAAVMLLCVSVALAETTTESSWSGTGSFQIDVVAGDDSSSHFETAGSLVSGNFKATDKNNNPYNYGVDSFDVFQKGSVSDGHAVFWTSRDDSKSSYGDAGQYTESGIMVSGGTGEFAFGTSNNYASMKNCNYGRDKTSSGKQFEANAGFFDIYSMLKDSDSDGAMVEVYGTGTALVDVMSGESSGSSFKFGKGCGCYTNADVEVNGVGKFKLNYWADNELDVGGLNIPGDGSDNSAKYDLNIDYAGSFSMPDFSGSGN